MAIPIILKGETAKPIPLALAEGYDYAGCSLHVDFCGTRSTFLDLDNGGSLELCFTAEQTAAFPLGTSKAMLSLENAAGEIRFMPWAKIKVTDSPADLYDAQITIDPATLNIDELPTRFNDEDVRTRIDSIIRWMKRTAAIVAMAASLPALGGLVVHTAQKGSVYNDSPVVTNVMFDGEFIPFESEISSNLYRGAWGSGPVWPYRRWVYSVPAEDQPWRPVLFDFSDAAVRAKGVLLNDGWHGLAALIQADYPDRTITTQALPRYVEARAVEPVTQLVWSAWHVVPSKWRILQDNGSALTLRADSIETEAERQINGVTWVHYNSTTVTGLASNISGVYAWRSKVHKYGHALEADRIADEVKINANAAMIETNAARIAAFRADLETVLTDSVDRADFDAWRVFTMEAFASYFQYAAATGFYVRAGVTNEMYRQEYERGYSDLQYWHNLPRFHGRNGFDFLEVVLVTDSYSPWNFSAWWRDINQPTWRMVDAVDYIDFNGDIAAECRIVTVHEPAIVTTNIVVFHGMDCVAYQSDIPSMQGYVKSSDLDAVATNLVETIIKESTYNLTYDADAGVMWRKVARNGVMYEECYTNVNIKAEGNQ